MLAGCARARVGARTDMFVCVCGGMVVVVAAALVVVVTVVAVIVSVVVVVIAVVVVAVVVCERQIDGFLCAYAELTPATRFTYAAQQLLTRRPVEKLDGLFNVAYAAPAVQLFVHHNDKEQNHRFTYAAPTRRICRICG